MKGFSSLLKIKKEDLRKIESRLFLKNQKREEILKEIESLLKELSLMKEPNSDNFGKLSLFKESVFNIHNLIQEKKEILKNLNSEIEQIKKDYQKAQIEYEKIKYIQKIEQKKENDLKKIKEQKEIDEIASILFERKI